MADVSVTLLDKWRLLQSIFADARLSQSAKVVAGVLLDHLNTTTRQCNPSLAAIEERCGLKRRQICAAIRDLRDHDVIGQKRRRGTSAYYFEFTTHPSDLKGEEVRESAPLTTDEVQETAPQNADDVRDSAHLQVRETAPLQVQDSAPLRETGNKKPGKGNREESISRTAPADDREIERRFEGEFWPTYPRKKDKDAALRTYRRIVKRGEASPEELAAGAARYRDDPARKDEFTKYPATWLNAGSWRDEPEAVGTSHRKDLRNGREQQRRDAWRDAFASLDEEHDVEAGPIIDGDYRRVGV